VLLEEAFTMADAPGDLSDTDRVYFAALGEEEFMRRAREVIRTDPDRAAMAFGLPPGRRQLDVLRAQLQSREHPAQN
jgi:hypothetical protein